MRKPNILVFMTDQERLDVTMPGHPCRTPNLERLQRAGLTFTHAFTPSSRDELYDLAADPYEMRNLIDEPALRPVVEELFVKLWAKAKEERDQMMSPYHTISLAPVGPAVAIGAEPAPVGGAR
ncbi:MAG: hypothetical protein JXR37_18790 [Kiritimatiellae bacterium]|nr:hypothetical protein [Kiritimatiellia bacterium]